MPALRFVLVILAIAAGITALGQYADSTSKALKGLAPLLLAVLGFVTLWMSSELERLRERVAKLEAHEAEALSAASPTAGLSAP
jgi:hypothetical protein